MEFSDQTQDGYATAISAELVSSWLEKNLGSSDPSDGIQALAPEAFDPFVATLVRSCEAALRSKVGEVEL